VKLKRAESYTFDVTFNIPENATLGDYSGKFNATSFYQHPTKNITFIYATVLKDFTLKVLPGEKLKAEIEANLSSFKSDMESLEQEINQSKKQGYNTSEVKNLLSQLKAKINEAYDYIDAGDYLSAYNLLDDIESLMNQTRNALAELKPTGVFVANWWDWGKWVVVGVVAVVIGLLGYMLWPTSTGYKPKREYPRMEVKDRVNEMFRKLGEKWKKIKERKQPMHTGGKK
jgi:hypothetical protein